VQYQYFINLKSNLIHIMTLSYYTTLST